MRAVCEAVGRDALEALDNPAAGFRLPLSQPQDTLVRQHDVARDVDHHIPELASRGEKRSN